MIRIDEDCEKMTKKRSTAIDNKEESEIDDDESTKTNTSRIGLV